MSRLEKIRQNRESQPLPYSRTEKEKKSFNVGGWISICLIILLLGGLVYVVFFSGLFDIKQIEVQGYQDQDKVVQIAKDQENRGPFAANIFLFNKNELKSALTGDPLVSDVTIYRKLPNKVLIKISQSQPSLIWITAGDKYLVDERGAVIGPAIDEQLPVVYDSSDIKVSRGDKVASPIFINFIKTVWDGFEPATKTKISKITIFDLISDVHVLSSGGFAVYMDASKDPNAELDNLTKVFTEAQKSTKKLEYIDLRLEDKAYYK